MRQTQRWGRWGNQGREHYMGEGGEKVRVVQEGGGAAGGQEREGRHKKRETDSETHRV